MRKLLIIILVLIMILIPAEKALAIELPDNPLQVLAVYVYEDCLEDGDVGVLIDYYIDYAALPTETAAEAYLAAFIQTDGITQLKAMAPYAYDNSGYRRGIIWMRFTPTEVTSYTITSASQALYSIWLMGNPTLSWTDGGVPTSPPKITSTIGYWQPSGTTSTLLALRVLEYAGILETVWAGTHDLIEATSAGNRLTAEGESYFSNAIPDLREMAPSCFSTGEIAPIQEDIDYTTSFGATATGAIIGGTVVLIAGNNVLNPAGAGTLTFELDRGTSGTLTGATVVGSPLALVEGTNTATITGAGAITANVNLVNTQTGATGTVIGTGFDLSALAALVGMSNSLFSGLVWMLITIVICAAFVKKVGMKGVLVILDISIVGGGVLGLLPVLVAVLMFIGAGLLTGYVLFFRQANV